MHSPNTRQVGALSGKEGDATPFMDVTVHDIATELHSLGYQRFGNEVSGVVSVISGISGSFSRLTGPRGEIHLPDDIVLVLGFILTFVSNSS